MENLTSLQDYQNKDSNKSLIWKHDKFVPDENNKPLSKNSGNEEYSNNKETYNCKINDKNQIKTNYNSDNDNDNADHSDDHHDEGDDDDDYYNCKRKRSNYNGFSGNEYQRKSINHVEEREQEDEIEEGEI
ncbi:hypothetical protein ACTFIW_002167 [Dictyostelium discoideum]